MTSICGLGEATLFQTHPVHTLALPGGSVSFSCTLQQIRCRAKGTYELRWQRGVTTASENNRFIFSGNSTYKNFTGMERYIVRSVDCTWTLYIHNVDQTDGGRYYSCYVSKVQTSSQRTDEYSRVARLTVVDPINTTVIPSQIERYVGQNATFRCQTSRFTTYELRYSWQIQRKDAIYSWSRVEKKDGMVEFIRDGENVTMRLNMGMNGSKVTCVVSINGSTSFKWARNVGKIVVSPNEETIEGTKDLVTIDSPSSQKTTEQTHSQKDYPLTGNIEPSARGPLNQQPTPSAPKTPSPPPTKKQDPDPDSSNPSSGFMDSTVISVGWSLAAVFICLFISSLLYIIVTKRRSKANPSSTRVVQTTQDEDAEAYEELHDKTLAWLEKAPDQNMPHLFNFFYSE